MAKLKNIEEPIIEAPKKVMFKLTKNIKLGGIRLSIGDCLELDTEDAKTFKASKLGMIEGE